MKKLSILLGAIVIGFGMAFAKEPSEKNRGGKEPDPIEKRGFRMEKRIREGIKSGELTETESKRLFKLLEDIRKKQERYKSDGDFTDGERKVLNRELDSLSKQIGKEKYDQEH